MGSFLFWLHLAVIFLSIISGFFLPLPFVILLVVLHKIHLIVFGDCLLTLLKRYRSVLRSDENFIQYTVKRFLSRRISARTSEAINYLIYILTLSASASRYV